MKTRGRPGMLVPTYQELQVDRNDTVETSLTCSTQASSCSTSGSIELAPTSRMWPRQSARQSARVLDRWDHVARPGGPAGAGDHEQIGEARRGDPEIGARAGPPFLG